MAVDLVLGVHLSNELRQDLTPWHFLSAEAAARCMNCLYRYGEGPGNEFATVFAPYFGGGVLLVTPPEDVLDMSERVHQRASFQFPHELEERVQDIFFV